MSRTSLKAYSPDAQNDAGTENTSVTAAPAAEELSDSSATPLEKDSARWLTAFFYGGSRYLPLMAFFAIWELVSRNHPSLSLLLPAPTQVIAGAIQLIERGELQQDTIASLKRVATALAFASVIGFPLGAALGASRMFLWLFEPILNFFRPIPPLAWIPLSIIWLGIGDAQNEFIIFLGAFFPIVLNTMQGVRDVDRQFVRAAQTLGANRVAIILTVILPGALSSMFIGFRIGLGIAWMALVAGELVAATSGLGFLISKGRLLFRSDYIVVGMVMIGFIGLLLDAGIRVLQRIVMPWRQT